MKNVLIQFRNLCKYPDFVLNWELMNLKFSKKLIKLDQAHNNVFIIHKKTYQISKF